MTQYLPPTVAQAGAQKLREAVQAGDPQMMEAIIEWGFEGIARVYDPDPIRRPLDLLRKRRAENEWRALVREMARQMQEVLARKQVEAFTYSLDRRIDEQKFEDHERRRRSTEGWNKDLRVGEFKETRSFETDEQIRLAQAMAEINGRLGAQAAPPPDPWAEVARIQAEMSRIAQDPTMSSAEKHRQTVPLQQALTQALANIGK